MKDNLEDNNEEDWDNFFVTLREEWESRTTNPDDEEEFQRFLFITSHVIYEILSNDDWLLEN